MKEISKESNVSLWERDSEYGGSHGPEYAVFKHPTAGIWIFSSVLDYWASKKKSQNHDYVLINLGKRRIGSSFRVSNLHGANVHLYAYARLPDKFVKTFRRGELKGSMIREWYDRKKRMFRDELMVPYQISPSKLLQIHVCDMSFSVSADSDATVMSEVKKHILARGGRCTKYLDETKWKAVVPLLEDFATMTYVVLNPADMRISDYPVWNMNVEFHRVS